MAQDNDFQFIDRLGEVINIKALWRYAAHLIQTVAIESSHQNIHDGIAFFCGYDNGDATLADNASQVILFRVGADSTAHLIRDVGVGGDFRVEAIEGVTVTATGSNTLTIFNKDRSSTLSSGCTAYHTPTTWSGGTALPTKLVPGGTGGNASGGADGGYSRELVCKTSTDYIFRITNRSGLPRRVSDILEWYEPNHPEAP